MNTKLCCKFLILLLIVVLFFSGSVFGDRLYTSKDTSSSPVWSRYTPSPSISGSSANSKKMISSDSILLIEKNPIYLSKIKNTNGYYSGVAFRSTSYSNIYSKERNEKYTLAPEMYKLTTDLLVIIDPVYASSLGIDQKEIYQTFLNEHMIIEAVQLGSQGSLMGDVVAVRIYLNPDTDFNLIAPYFYQEIERTSGEYGADYWQISGYVPLKNLEKIALLKEVREIIPMYPSITK